jgi:putative DNA primase/helicase
MDFLSYALRYLAAGLRPIPCFPRAKAPAAAKSGQPTDTGHPLADWHEYQRRPPTEEELSQWFATDRFNMGTVIPPGWIVLDFDGGKDAETLLTRAGVSLPENTPRVRSGSGGHHCYLRLPSGVADFQKLPGSKFLHNVDSTGKPCKPFVEVLTVNNFVVLPPSVHPNGKSYEWTVDFDDVPEAPAELMALIRSKQNPTAAEKPAKAAKVRKNEPGWVEELSRGTGPHTHDDSMAKLAGYYLRKRLTIENVVEILESGYAKKSWNDGPNGARLFGVIKRSDIERVVNSVARAEERRKQVDQSEFQLLGYQHEKYFYLSRATGQVVDLTAREHDKNNLLRVASLRYWEQRFGTEHGIFWPGAQALLMEEQHKIGIFDADRFRGRGAWWDERLGAVMHTGSHLLVAGRSVPIKEVEPGHHIYELDKSLDVQIGNPLSADNAREVLELFESLSWEHPHHARLAAGWCVVAAICGALDWRPHIWVSGPSGSGKSWVVTHMIRPLLGKLALLAQSETTEAGLRQTLGHDARAVIFDEAEAEGQRGDSRMANVLALIRQASSETGGSIIKGSTDGTAKSYLIRSCFAMSSINISAYQAADKNRISILEMHVDTAMSEKDREAAFTAISGRVTRTLNPAFTAGFRARAIRMIPVIRENARILASEAGIIIGSQRLGDQIGTLLAGAYSLLCDDVIDPEHARELLKDQDLSEQRAIKDQADEEELLNYIKQSVLQINPGDGRKDLTIATLIRAAQQYADAQCLPEYANAALALVGLKTAQDGLLVANTHKGLANLLKDTHWRRDWSRVLKRLPGAVPAGPLRIGDVTCRAVMVPWLVAE